ncbi:DUF2065 domain-containing protein [Ottowia sp.]|uniref:DUF2065 domain-containing protein n=1 Tax=Ottowia sp. TaxID=1898956 RepID=UPI003A8908BC
MNSDTLWLALGLFLILEGLTPFIAPGAWRKMLQQISQMQDGQARFFGLMMLMVGLVLLWLLK